MTLVCVPILADDADQALADAEAARRAGADLVEFRLDRLFRGEGDGDGLAQCLRLVRESPLPCIATCRIAAEGGEYDGDEASRIALFERLGAEDRPPRYIDVELAAYERSANLRQKVHLATDQPSRARDLAPGLILSMHDFSGRPDDLLRRIARLRTEPAAAVHKIAFRARSLRDNLELFDLLSERDRPTIALAMGQFGLPSRILAPKFGGLLTFASLRPSTTTAPGQPTIDEALNLYRLRSIGPSTRVYGVVGWPVEHSLSPLVHNAGFHAPGVESDAVYLPLPIPPEWEHLKATLSALLDHAALDFRGASVTAPHKEHLIRLATERGWTIDPLAARIGAANTLVVDERGDVRIANTDAPAAAECLRRAMGWLKGRRIAVIGAGGLARAVCVALLDEGATIAVYNRTHARAETLVESLRAASPDAPGRITAAPWEKLCGSCCEAFVQCTTLGMEGGPDASASPLAPDEFEHMPPGTVAFETIYRPLRTPFLNAALDAGVQTIDGLSLFILQAEAQFRMFTGADAPPGLFERLVRAAPESED